MTPKVRKHAFRLNQAYAEVDRVLAEWRDGTIAKYHCTEALANGRLALQSAIAANKDEAILAMPVPMVVGTNVLWNVKSQHA